MAYVIGSDKGKNIAKNMKAGESYKCSDGSTWTKKSDGSVSVTHNGQTYSNAYTPSSSGSSSNKSSGGSSGGGNSQYTTYNYTIGSDYGKQVAQNMGIGQTFTATDGSVWKKENDGSITVNYNGQTYKNAYTPSNSGDWGILGKQQVEAGVPYQYVQNTLDSRVDKALNTLGLEKYAYDDTYKMMMQYIVDNMRESNQPDEWNDEMYEQENPREEYNNPYKAEIDALLNQILNRDDFSYDVMNDPLYQQYAKMYQREGDRAMKETMAEAAAGAGGMNTYAITAAQQANSYYGSQLNDKIPQLYQLAYDMYLNDKESKVQDLGILQNMDATQYGRYRDTINDWYNDKNFAYGVYQDAVQQGNWNTNFNYNTMLDNRNWNNDEYWKNKEWNYNDEWKNKEYTDNRADIDYERNQAEEAEAKATIEWYIKNGVTTIDPNLIKKAGLDQSAVNQMIAKYQAEQAAKVTSSRGGDPSYTPIEDDGKKKQEEKKQDDLGYNPTGDDAGDEGSSNYTTVLSDCEKMAAKGDKWGAAAYAKEAYDAGHITKEEYSKLLAKYNPLLDTILAPVVPTLPILE